MPAVRIHRALSNVETEKVRRIMRDLNSHGTLVASTEKMVNLVNKLVSAKYARGYHAGYVRGQRNPIEDLEDELL